MQSWSTVWYCDNSQGADLYLGALSWDLTGFMDSRNSWFVCYRRGQQHKGGNDVWYYTQGDRPNGSSWEAHRYWGYMPAYNVYSSVDPIPGMPECQPDMWLWFIQDGQSERAVWYGHLNKQVVTVNGSRYSGNSGLASFLNRSPHWFQCYDHGDQHAGGNNIWYYTQTDSGFWGWVAAVDLTTRKDPYDEIPSCEGKY